MIITIYKVIRHSQYLLVKSEKYYTMVEKIILKMPYKWGFKERFHGTKNVTGDTILIWR